MSASLEDAANVSREILAPAGDAALADLRARTPRRFRKLPVEIDALQWDGTAAGATPIIDWVLNNGGTARYASPQPETRVRGKVVREAVPALLAIDTLEGTMHGVAGDWIIRGVQGELYPCKPDIFAETYEQVRTYGNSA